MNETNDKPTATQRRVTAESLADLLGGKRSGVNGSYRCHCPAHDDKTASLSVKDGDSKLLVKCHAGCQFEHIAQKILEIHGMEIRGFSDGHLPNKTLDGMRLVAEYVYTDNAWRPIAKKLRFEAPDGSKTMRWMRRDGNKWVPGMDGVQKTGMLYRKPDIRRAASRGVPVHVCEGEKACDLLISMNMPATCQPDGAGPGKFTREHAIEFSGADVVIWADNDQIGEAYASEVCAMVRPFAKSVRIVQSATGGMHDDAYDHFVEGHTMADAVDRSDLVPRAGHRVVTLDSFEPCLPDYIWEPYLPAGKLVLLDADGGTGKTTFCLALAASLGNGCLPASGVWSTKPIRTLYYGDEDDPGEWRTIFDECGGNPAMIGICREHFNLDDQGLSTVEETIVEGKYGLVVFDALLYYLSRVVKDANQSYDVAPYIAGLAGVARRTGATIIGIRHVGKRTKETEAKHLGLGSVQFRNSARGQLVMRYHPREPGVRVVTHEKGSILTPQGRPFAWRRVGYAVEWIGEIEDPWNSDVASVVERSRTFNPDDVVAEQSRANDLLANLMKRGAKNEEIVSAFEKAGYQHLYATACNQLGLPLQD